MPSGDVMTPDDLPSLFTATKRLLPKVTEVHVSAVAADREVQVMPSGDVMTRDAPFLLTATKRLLPKVTEYQMFASAAVRLVQIMRISGGGGGDGGREGGDGDGGGGTSVQQFGRSK